MFKILTYAYSPNIYSSRKIEVACRRDINFIMWLLAGQKVPNYGIIARFRTGFLADTCERLFYQMVKRMKQADELSKETVFMDRVNGKVEINDIWNFFENFLNGRSFMTGIRQAFRAEIIIVKQIRMQPSCT